MKYKIDSTSLTAIADAIREKTGKSALMTPTEMPDEIASIGVGESEYWTRPSDWPDLDSIDFTGFEGFYLTYKLDEVCETGQWISLLATTNSGDYVVEKGHLVNGSFVSDFSQTVTRNQPFQQQLNPQDGNIQLWRVVPDTGHLTSGGVFQARETDGYTFPIGFQPCVEQYSKGEYLTSTNMNNPTVTITGTARIGHITYFLQHDRIIGTTNYSSLGMMWHGCPSLRLIDFDNAAFPNVTSLAQLFTLGSLPKKVDFSGADLSNVTNMQLAFNSNGIEYLDFSTVGSNVTTFSRILEGNYSLKEVYPCAIGAALPFTTAQRLSADSINRIIMALKQVSEALTITFDAGVKAALTQEQISTITGKGWTIA